MMADPVAIIFDPDFADALRGLPDCDVWVTGSSKNLAVVDDLRRVGHTRITTFVDHPDPDADAFDGILSMVELHHGEYSQDPPFQRAVVYGLAFDEAFNESLSAVGFELEERTPDGFRIHRAAEPPT